MFPQQTGVFPRKVRTEVFSGPSQATTHLVNEGRELAVETLDLLLLFILHTLSIGVDLQVQGREQALIDRDGGDAGRAGPTDASRTVSEAASTGARAEAPNSHAGPTGAWVTEASAAEASQSPVARHSSEGSCADAAAVASFGGYG